MTDHDTLRGQINEVIIPAMIEHGPDGHIDGYREITDAVIDVLGLQPCYEARLTSGGGSVYRTLEEAQNAHKRDIARYGLPGDPISLEQALTRGETYDLDEMPPRVYADGIYVRWETKAQRID